MTYVVLGIFVVVLGAAAFGISKAQEQSRNTLVDRFNERAAFGSLFLGSILKLSAQAQAKDAALELGGPHPDAQTLRRFMKKLGARQPYARLLDANGNVLAATPAKAAEDPKLLAHNPDLGAALRGGTASTGNVTKIAGDEAVIESAVPFDTPQGRRIIAIGSPVGLFDAFMKTFLQGIPAVGGGQAYILDDNNRVLASASGVQAGARLNDPALLAALTRDNGGRYEAGGGRRFVSERVPDSSLRVALAAPESTLFAAVERANNLIWLLYGAFATALIASLVLLSRVHRRKRQLDLAEQDQRARAELAGEQTRADAEAERLKSEFFGIVSHELRTPLTSIVGYVDLLMERDHDELSEGARGRLDVVHRNARRLDRLVQDLLMMTQLEAGTFDIEPGEVDVRELARNCEPEARLMAEVADIRFSIDCEEIPVFAGDSHRIAQVLDNLISNAVKFTPAGGKVGVRIAAEDGRCMLEVSDTGAGIEEKDLAQLFKRFYRGEAAPTGKVPGAGLGLAIIEAIVELHGGEVVVDSEPGRGSTFRVFLPMTPVPSAPGRETATLSA
jgi:signal transduction histidine kinase